MSDEIRAEIKAAAKAHCHYPSGPNSANSCCQGIGRCEMDYAIAEITRLRAALATARREGMEEAAKIAENEPEPEGEPPPELHGRSVKNIAIASVRATKRSIAAAIRAAAGEGK